MVLVPVAGTISDQAYAAAAKVAHLVAVNTVIHRMQVQPHTVAATLPETAIAHRDLFSSAKANGCRWLVIQIPIMLYGYALLWPAQAVAPLEGQPPAR